MVRLVRSFKLLLVLTMASLALSGCLIDTMSADTTNGVTTLQVTATLLPAPPCSFNTTTQTTRCDVSISFPFPGEGELPITLNLVGFTTPLTLYDPLIVQVPASMSNFSGSITAGPAGVAPGTPLSILSGLSTVPVDATRSLVAEPGMQLLIIDLQSPASAPSGSYTLKLQFSGTTDSIKILFAAKVAAGAQTYYVPIAPCVTDLALVTPIKLPLSTSNLGTWLGKLLGCDNLTPSQPYNFAGTTPPGIELNQQGLTGSWYEPATSGQGFEVEVFPDFTGPGVGLTQVSWFTFDALAGGADRQRWYTLSGNVQNGQPTASLTIYRNVGGNFNAPPTTNGVAVGTAALRFDSCSGGELAYSFTDGSGRNGTIPLTRLTQNATCSTTGARPTNADFALSGNWYQPATSGQGFTVEVNPGSATLFFAWYTYAPGGAAAGAAGQRWYTGQGSFAPGMRSVPVTLYETTGGVFDSTATAPHSVPVGTATLAFQSCSSATLNFNFTGGSSAGTSGAIALSRIGPVPSGCT
jgi:hypothetical protein